MKTFYRKNSFGIGRWCIWQEGNTICFGHSATLDGKMNVQTEEIEEGKAGRSIQEQIDLRMNSRISKMLDKGYKETADEAAKASTNQLGLVTPMLAKPLKASRLKSSLVQPKLNGHRCLITNVDGDIVTYSRQGKLITTIDHITEQFKDLLPEGCVVDGELYIHGEKLQKIASLVKRKQPGSNDLLYYAYDYVDLNDAKMPFQDRLIALKNLIGNMHEPVKLTETTPVADFDEAMATFKMHIDFGFEGTMVRDPMGLYESGKRSSSLLKIKPLFDTEVEVLDVVPGDTGLGVCVCRMAGLDRSFKILAPGTHSEKRECLENKADYIGKRLKVEYRELTADGVPFHAVATEWFTSI